LFHNIANGNIFLWQSVGYFAHAYLPTGPFHTSPEKFENAA